MPPLEPRPQEDPSSGLTAALAAALLPVMAELQDARVRQERVLADLRALQLSVVELSSKVADAALDGKTTGAATLTALREVSAALVGVSSQVAQAAEVSARANSGAGKDEVLGAISKFSTDFRETMGIVMMKLDRKARLG